MTTTSNHPMVDDYLRRLDAAAKRLPKGERNEVVAEIRAHLDAGVGPDSSEAEVRHVLDDLGDPDVIVSTALPDAAPKPTLGRVSLVLALTSVATVAALATFEAMDGSTYTRPGPLLAVRGLAGTLTLPLAAIATILGLHARRAARAAGTVDRPATVGFAVGALAVTFEVVMYAIFFWAMWVR